MKVGYKRVTSGRISITTPTSDRVTHEMLADGSDALVAYEPALSEDEGNYSAHELCERAEKAAAKANREKKKTKSFRMYGKGYCITFPQCDTSKSDAAATIEHKWPEALYVISQEEHQDGNHHLHIYMEFPERKQFKTPSCFDVIGRKHGDYEVTKNRRKWIEYVVKQDKEHLAKGIDVKAVLAKKKAVNQEMAEMLMEGKSMEELNEVNKGYVMINKRKLEDYGQWIKILKARKEKEEWIYPDFTVLTGSNRKIGQWITENIRTSRQFKAPQLFIHGPPNHGKTTLIQWLEKSLSVYHIPLTEDFYDGYDDEYDVAVLDEFKGQKTIQWLNQWLDGQKMTLRKKGSQYLKTKNIPTIILSNYKLEECYKKAAEDGRLDSLMSRLKIVEVESFIKIV